MAEKQALQKLKITGDTAINGESESSIKRKFSEQGAPLMTIDLSRELDAYEEIEDWFIRIKAYIAE